jgi:hypothetical protein
MQRGEWVEGPGGPVAAGTSHPLGALRGLTPRPDFALFSIRWDLQPRTAPFFPFAYRDSSGAIFYPPVGRAVVWAPELVAALRGMAGPHPLWRGVLEVERWVAWKPEEDLRPFAFLRGIYDHRASVKDKDPGLAMVDKLAMNSVYGKLCQQVGGTSTKLPPWFQMAWAGWVTAAIRARLLRMALLDPLAVVAFMTDGLFIRRLPRTRGRERFGFGLGEWSAEPVEELVSVNSGVYFETVRGEVISHFRGFDPPGRSPDGEKEGLSRELVLQGYAAGAPFVEAPSTRFVQMGRALQEDWSLYCQWLTIPRKCDLRSSPGGAKRYLPTRRGDPGRGLQRTLATPVYEARFLPSSPYPLLWGRSAESLLVEEWEDSFL